jgi:hypothetical protein
MCLVMPYVTSQALIGRWSFYRLPSDTWLPRGKIGFRSDSLCELDFIGRLASILGRSFWSFH